VLKVDLTGKVAVVTGGSGELGRIIVRTLADCGADVAVQYLNNKAKADAAAREVRRFRRRALVVQADVTSKPDVLALRD
jgi:3-oxoacyl-[acyl-carrier protein] reductase